MTLSVWGFCLFFLHEPVDSPPVKAANPFQLKVSCIQTWFIATDMLTIPADYRPSTAIDCLSCNSISHISF